MIPGQEGAHRAGHGKRQRNFAAPGDRRPAKRFAASRSSSSPPGQFIRWRCCRHHAARALASGSPGSVSNTSPSRRSASWLSSAVRQRPMVARDRLDHRRPGSLRLAPGALDFSAAQHRADRADQAFGNLVLQIERIFERAVKPLGPQMLSARCLDELAADANPVAGLSEAALVESECGAVTLGQACVFPPLSFGVP